jgi:dinuclear metal center YbgI/SA1388 family protein
MQLSTIADRLDDRLCTADYADIDASANGLQVGPRDKTIERAAVAVDAARETVSGAVEADADLLVTHHGLSWGGIERVTGRNYRRLEPLLSGDCALYVSHLPLDGHQTLGNAAGLADILDLTDRDSFATMGGEPIGQRGRLADPTPLADIVATLDTRLDTGGQPIRTLDHGPATVESVAIVTGSGADFLDAAVAADADLLLTGEGKQKVYHQAREEAINVVLAGHYATETFGVRALADLLADWGVETTFLDAPTGL